MENNEASAAKIRVALSSVIAAVGITLLKLIVGLETNSLGILSEAAHSGLDMLAAILTLIAVKVSDRPPDKEHLYGHGRIENLSAFIETGLLVATCGWIIVEAIERLLTRTAHVEANVWGYAVIALSIVIDISRSRALSRAARTYKSQALEADALHFSSDVYSSAVVLIGLVFVNLGQPLVDAVAAIIVSAIILLASYRLGRRTVQALMDRVPEGMIEEITQIIRSVEGVSDLKAIRLRQAGAHLFLDATVAIPRTMLFQQAHDVMDRIERSVRARHADIDVLIHAEPFERKDETIAERIQMIILEKGLGAPHHLEIHRRDDHYHVEFDIEFSRGKNFVEAHAMTAAIEQDIRDKLPQVKNVTIHMEEYHPETNEVEEVTGREATLRRQIAKCLSSEKRIIHADELQLLKIGDKYNLSVNCHFEQSMTLGEIHQIVSAMEGRLYEQFKQLRRVTIHAEPA